MNFPSPKRTVATEPGLSVSYRAPHSLDHFLQNLPDVVIITDPLFIIKAFNNAAETFFGLPASHFIGSNLKHTVKFKFRNSSKEAFLETLFRTSMWNGEIVFNRNNNQEFIFNSNVSLLYDENGAASSIVLVNHNITEEEKHKSKLAFVENKYRIVVNTLSEGVLLINEDGMISAANQQAVKLLGFNDEQELKEISLTNPGWNAIRADGTLFPPEEFPAVVSLKTGLEANNVIMGLRNKDKNKIWISINSRPIFNNGNAQPEGVVISFEDITKERETTEKLRESEIFFRSFMTNSPTLGWIYDQDGNFVYGNPLFIKIVGFESAAIGKNIFDISSPEIANRIVSMNKRVIATGESMISEDELKMPDGTIKYFVANYFAIPGKNQTLIGGQAIDITERKNAEKEIAKMHERFGFVVNASSDAIWDVDFLTNQIYRSDTFCKISGYSKEEIKPTLEWWVNKIHPEDRDRVNNKIDAELRNGNSHWNDEYRFQHADGSYRYICDKGFAIYENGIPVRQIGSMQDITERKVLEGQLLYEQVQKQKVVNQATINAQEEERNRISRELHDNVNQLLMSARLHIGVAKNNSENQKKILDKATDYLLMAVEEIRALSKRMNSKVVSSVGLLESIADIVYNMQEFQNMEIHTDIDISLIEKLNAEQKLMVFRIVQEQTANIIKHAEATVGNILLKEVEGNIHLNISDNGKGFDTSDTKLNGIGHINIFNRVDAYNGKAEIISSPGNGCSLNIIFPL
ncbi:MAG: PAS domain S-box protein [Ferruginibacter sp.]